MIPHPTEPEETLRATGRIRVNPNESDDPKDAQYETGGVGFACGRWGKLGCAQRVIGVVVFAEFIGVRPGGRRWLVRFVLCRFYPGGLRVCSGLLGSFGSALGVIMYDRGRWVHRGAPMGSPRLFWAAGLIVCALGVVGIVRVHSVHWDAPLCSSGFFGFAGFIGVRPGRSSGSLWFSGFLGVSSESFTIAWFIGVPVGSFGLIGVRHLDVGFVRGRWINRCTPWGSSCSFGVAGFHLGGPWLSSCSVGVAGYIGMRPEVVGFVRVRWVHWSVVGVVQGRLVYWGARWDSSGSFG